MQIDEQLLGKKTFFEQYYDARSLYLITQVDSEPSTRVLCEPVALPELQKDSNMLFLKIFIGAIFNMASSILSVT